MKIPVVVSTCDKYLWALKPFAYLFNGYWSEQQQVIVVGYKAPNFALPSNFEFYSIAPVGWPANRWSTGMLDFFAKPDAPEIFVWLLEDYWLNRRADVQGIETLADYVSLNPGVLRLDLTTDRLYNGQMFDSESFAHFDIVETPAGSPYQMSLQAGIWRKSHLLRILEADKTPWQVEIETSPPENFRVVGTRQFPLRYLNAFKGENPNELLNLDKLSDYHFENIIKMIPENIRKDVQRRN